MNILILVYFKAAAGGLHENIRATVKQLLAAGAKCTVVCREGIFASELRAIGVTLVCTDFSETQRSKTVADLSLLHQADPFTLIHTHPFASRVLAQQLATSWRCPLVTTIHGKYTDKLEENQQEFAAIFAVSTGIRDFLLEMVGPEIAHKVMVFPNAVDLSVFTLPSAESDTVKCAEKKSVVITLVSRFDRDKQFIMDTFLAAVSDLVHSGGSLDFEVVLVGQGSEQENFINALTGLLGQEKVSYLGWLQGEQLANAYHSADIVVAPGRCALEAMACAKPTIAIGSKGYVGLIDSKNWQMGVYTNFGGVGNKEADYETGTMSHDISTLFDKRHRQQQLGRLGRTLVELFYNEESINRQMISAYHLLSLSFSNRDK